MQWLSSSVCQDGKASENCFKKGSSIGWYVHAGLEDSGTNMLGHRPGCWNCPLMVGNRCDRNGADLVSHNPSLHRSGIHGQRPGRWPGPHLQIPLRQPHVALGVMVGWKRLRPMLGLAAEVLGSCNMVMLEHTRTHVKVGQKLVQGSGPLGALLQMPAAAGSPVLFRLGCCRAAGMLLPAHWVPGLCLAAVGSRTAADSIPGRLLESTAVSAKRTQRLTGDVPAGGVWCGRSPLLRVPSLCRSLLAGRSTDRGIHKCLHPRGIAVCGLLRGRHTSPSE
jgi:hypothetical protein